MFGRMFPRLPAFTAPTADQIAALAQTMLDSAGTEGNNTAVPSGFTYLGQFIDHDITRDESPPPTGPVDPTTLRNFRTPALDLDSVYGGGPQANPELYDGAKLKIGVSPDGLPDLPRRPDGSAIVGDNRNDENLIVAQLHAAFIKFHNTLVDGGATFAVARRQTVLHYQYLIVHDYLPAVVGADQFRRLAAAGLRTGRFGRPSRGRVTMPVEFAVAAFRFGHSEVRRGYELSALTDGRPVAVFSLDGVRDLRGGRSLPAGMGIDWTYFFNIEGVFDELGNFTRLVDTKISPSLFQLPIPGAEATGSNVLAFRNMTRGVAYGLPSGQAVARALGIRPITPAELALGPGFEAGTPLWYYVLAESQLRAGGLHLGPVGANIVTNVLLSLLARTDGSVLNRPFRPTVPHAGAFTMGDFLIDAGVVLPEQLEPEEEEEG